MLLGSPQTITPLRVDDAISSKEAPSTSHGVSGCSNGVYREFKWGDEEVEELNKYKAKELR